MIPRVRVGLIGLATVFLLVMLAAALLKFTAQGPTTDNAATLAENGAAPSEPLAQLGVAPGNPQADEATASRAPAPAAARTRPAAR